MRDLSQIECCRLVDLEFKTLLQHIEKNYWPEEYLESPKGWFATYFPTIGCMPTHFTIMQKWEHAFLDLELLNRTPTWREMNVLKRFYWKHNETVIQIHPKRSEYVNFNKYRLHLWKQHNTNFKLPPIQKVINRFEVPSIYPINSLVKMGSIDNWDYVVIICGKNWATWEEVCEIKKKYFGDDHTALQFHTGNINLDENNKHILTLWDAKDIPLPNKHIV